MQDVRLAFFLYLSIIVLSGCKISDLGTIPTAGSTCTGSYSNGVTSLGWTFPALEKGSQKIQVLMPFNLTEVQLYLSTAGVSEFHVEVYGDGSQPMSGPLLASSIITSGLGSTGLFTFPIPNAPAISGSYFYLVFWSVGAGFNTSLMSNMGFPPVSSQAVDPKIIWDNSTGTWNNLGNYNMGMKISYSMTTCSY